jgi:hypothetical protein
MAKKSKVKQPAKKAKPLPPMPALEKTNPANPQRHSRRGSIPLDESDQRRRDREVTRQRARLAAGSDIGEIPEIVNPERRKACERNLNLALCTYFPNSTGLTPLSTDHDEVIANIEGCILGSGAYANAVYRGFAKSTIGENSLIWGTLNGHIKFGALFAAEGSLSSSSLSSIKMELAENDLLFEDFPEVCLAFRALEGKSQRCGSQTYRGELTHIKWTVDQLVFPTIEGSVSSGAVIAARGMTASILGLRHKKQDGTQLRPDFVIVDDPQTRDSATHPQQVKKRLDILSKSILMLAGHRSRMACVVNGTVIADGDMMDQLLDPRLFPAFQGKRIPMVKSFAARHDDMWLGKYRDLRHGFRKDDPEDKRRAMLEGNAYYEDNLEEMNRGCVVSWASCFSEAKGEISAIQHAYNILIDEGPEVFASECQNEPLRDSSVVEAVTSENVRTAILDLNPMIVPSSCEIITAFCDVQEKLLYWLVAAWGPSLRGHVLCYGTYPEQPRSYFTLRDAKKTLAKVAGVGSKEAAIDAGLPIVAREVLGREFIRENDDAVLKCSVLLIDANWAQTRNVIRDYARRSPWGPRVMPSHGRFVGATSGDNFDKKPEKGERSGANWRTETRERVRHLVFDANAWKSLVAEKIKLPSGESSSITIHAGRHDLLSDHWTAEYPLRSESKLRVAEEWKLIPGRDNHWWDSIVGAAVGASYHGISGVGAASQPVRKRREYSAEEVARRREEVLAMMR